MSRGDFDRIRLQITPRNAFMSVEELDMPFDICLSDLYQFFLKNQNQSNVAVSLRELRKETVTTQNKYYAMDDKRGKTYHERPGNT